MLVWNGNEFKVLIWVKIKVSLVSEVCFALHWQLTKLILSLIADEIQYLTENNNKIIEIRILMTDLWSRIALLLCSNGVKHIVRLCLALNLRRNENSFREKQTENYLQFIRNSISWERKFKKTAVFHRKK